MRTAHRVDDRRRRGDIAAQHAEGLGQGAVDDREPVHQPALLGDAAAMRPVEADGVDLVEIGHRAIAVGEIAEILDRRNIAVHRIDRFESDQLGPVGPHVAQQLLEMRRIAVAEYALLDPAVADAFDHRGVVPGVRQDDAAGQHRGERRERGEVGHVARGEDQRGGLAVELGKLALELDQRVRGARNVAGAAAPAPYSAIAPVIASSTMGCCPMPR